jgi:hypothetical protein
VPALGEGEEEREEARAEEKPARDLHRDRHRAGEHAQHEAGGDRHDVEDDRMLEPGRVEQVERQVAGEERRERAGEREAAGERAAAEQRCRRRRDRRRQLPRGDRPQALERMLPVLGAVAQVVGEVDRARRGAEERERRGGARQELRVVEPVREDERREHEEVLHPLRGAE